MPKVVTEGEFDFIINLRELPFEPPHVHVRFGGQEVRIELDAGTFMEQPPGGKGSKIIDAYRKHAAIIRENWDKYHKR